MSANPVVYFIDDSATMREVIKIAFRRENINVVACHDALSAIGLMEQNVPDVVISDVIMPEKDGYEVCQYIKQHPTLGRTPVILMSGVVNKQVAEKAFAVKADELIRKPFQPQDLITRVRHLLNPKAPAEAQPAVAAPAAAAALSSIFAAPATRPMATRPAAQVPPAIRQPVAMPVPAAAVTPRPIATPQFAAPVAQVAPVPVATSQAVAPTSRVPAPPSSMDASKMRLEIMRLMSQIKKLESELEAEREYARALEEHIKTLQESE
ncbi:MAG: response regulator [Terriglobia bacterium]|jgi:CheY-like chemotaxis protein|nr:response regulator [Terriglobia bacterium]